MRRWKVVLAGAGAAGAVGAAAADPDAAAGAAGQTWPAFVLVAGLLLVGLVAARDGLFAWAGARLAAAAPAGWLLFMGVTALVAVVTAVLNLDTSVAFLTPVLVHTAARRREDATLLLSLCLLLSNAGSLLLPGSNLTNLIVLGNRPMAGGRFFAHMALPWVVAVVVTAGVAAVSGRRMLRRRVLVADTDKVPVRVGAGLAAVVAVVALVVLVRSPAPEVAAVGVIAAAVAVGGRRLDHREVLATLDLPVLVGLFGLAVALGTLGRAWTGPVRALGHLGPLATAAVGAGATVLVNNLPAAALLSARPPRHPLSLLIGLDIGPNLFVSGSLAWVLWHSAARASGGRPDIGRTVRLGLVAAPLAVIAAVGALLLTGGLS